MKKYFGTDGIRGIVGKEITPDLAFKTAAAHGFLLKKINLKPQILIASDTRNSKDMLLAACTSGYCYSGVDVINIGVLPTPALSYLICEYKKDGGLMLSASHNPNEYNGIKLFSKGGLKLTDEQELEIESFISDFNIGMSKEQGREEKDEKYKKKYIKHIINCAEQKIDNFNILLDCSNGSASKTAKSIFDSLKIQTKIINKSPNGFNINENCGSTCMHILCDKMKDSDYDIGFAFDGDADRCLASDKLGREISGDKILAVIALYLKKADRLKKDAIVATVMSNLGLIEIMNKNNINVPLTTVGDRYVLEEMIEKQYTVGGEDSGHIIFIEKALTGDGQLTAVMLLCAMKDLNLTGEDVFGIFQNYPQKQININANDLQKKKLMSDEIFSEDIKNAEKAFSKKGRILIRPSGTEPYIRILVEGKVKSEVELTAKKIKESAEIRLSQLF